MKTKLTLSIDPEIAAYAHAEAKRKATSVSAIVSDYFEGVRRHQDKSKHYTVDDMVGIFEGADIDDSKEGIAAAYAEKYLR